MVRGVWGNGPSPAAATEMVPHIIRLRPGETGQGICCGTQWKCCRVVSTLSLYNLLLIHTSRFITVGTARVTHLSNSVGSPKEYSIVYRGLYFDLVHFYPQLAMSNHSARR
jgi:hypothetical protein